MRYFLYLNLQGFYTLHHWSEPGAKVVIKDDEAFDADPEALSRGVMRGMPVRQARAILHDGRFILWERERYEKSQKQWLDACLPYTGAIEPEGQHSAYLDLSGHPDPLDVAEQAVRSLALLRFDALHSGAARPNIQYAAAQAKWIAKLALAAGSWDGAIRDCKSFLLSLPTECLTPVKYEDRERLIFLGYRTVGEIAKLSIDTLRAQFGSEALLIKKASMGELLDEIKPLYPLGSLVESYCFEEPIDSTEILDKTLKRLALRVGNRLSAQDKQAQEAELFIELEDGERLCLKRKFSKPITGYVSALFAFRQLAARKFEKAIVSVRVALHAIKRKSTKQGALIGTEKTMPEGALGFVQTVYGDKAVQLGSQLHVPRRVRVLRAWKDATGWK